jgi:hypothetical protein
MTRPAYRHARRQVGHPLKHDLTGISRLAVLVRPWEALAVSLGAWAAVRCFWEPMEGALQRLLPAAWGPWVRCQTWFALVAHCRELLIRIQPRDRLSRALAG